MSKFVNPALLDTASKNKSDEILENIYHKAQDKIWDGRQVLQEILDKHGEVAKLEDGISESLHKIFAVILWGEYAAWKISLQLAENLENPEAKMAATSQAHDEARHFYSMRDYLFMHGDLPDKIPRSVDLALEMVVSTDNMAKKLLGMQLMIEPIALTIFQEVRKAQIEPVLSELLEYFERDEARHIALGVHCLPDMIKQLSVAQVISLIVWQFKLFLLELQGLNELKGDFKNIGLDPEKMFELAEFRQLEALKQFTDQMNISPHIWEPIRQLVRYQKKRVFYENR